jgi:ABC-type transport system involved in Fe-S cluster assembly fused permease/ATPase subunit
MYPYKSPSPTYQLSSIGWGFAKVSWWTVNLCYIISWIATTTSRTTTSRTTYNQPTQHQKIPPSSIVSLANHSHEAEAQIPYNPHSPMFNALTASSTRYAHSSVDIAEYI